MIYASAVTLYFIDFLQHNRKVNQVAFWLLSIVWVLQGIYFCVRVVLYDTLPFFTQSDTLFFYAWILISFSLMSNWFFKMDIILLITNFIGFAVMAVSVFMIGRTFSDKIAEQLTSEWIIIHIIMAFTSYAVFTVSCILSAFYLVQRALLKRKKWFKQFRHLPGLVQLEKLSLWMNMIGVPLLALSLILGIIWAYWTIDTFILFDSKVLFSVFVILMYSTYLYQKLIRGWSGKQLAELNIVCFIVLVVNYFVSTAFSDFHM